MQSFLNEVVEREKQQLNNILHQHLYTTYAIVLPILSIY